MQDWLLAGVRDIAFFVDMLAIVIITYASVESFIMIVRTVSRRGTDADRRRIWLRFAQWPRTSRRVAPRFSARSWR